MNVPHPVFEQRVEQSMATTENTKDTEENPRKALTAKVIGLIVDATSNLGGLCVLCGLLALLVVPPATAIAQKAPGLGYAYPPVVRAGETTELQLGGFDFTDDLQWFVHDARIKLDVLGPPGDYHLPPPPYWTGLRASSPALPIPREVTARIVVPAEVPAGPIRWQVANANGSSATAVLLVSRGTEILENRSRDFPQQLPALSALPTEPMAVSGRLSRLTEVDQYELVAPHDGLVSVDLMARRLGADFNGALQVRDAKGNVLADFADTQGLDGGVTFAVQAGQKYSIRLHDVDFRGDRSYVYRLEVRSGPRVVCTLPARGQRGTTRDVEFIGWGVASGRSELESVRQAVTFPPHSQADSEADAHTHLLRTASGDVEVAIPLSDLDELAGDVELKESAPLPPVASTVTPQTPQPAGGEAATTASTELPPALAAPVAVTRRLMSGENAHRYRWIVEQGESWSIQAQSRAIGGRLDVALQVLDPTGKQIHEIDDLPGTPDAALEFLAGATGTYTCVVRGMSSLQGAADELYRLELRRAEPDFALTAPQQIAIPLGGKTDVLVKAVRTGGFAGEIRLTVDDLPAGVTAQGDWTIPAGKNELKVSLQAAGDAAVVAGLVRFRGAGQLGEQPVTRAATAAAAGNLCPRSPSQQQLDASLLAMTMAAPFEVLVVDRERQRDVPRGTTYLAPLQIVRQDGFTGEIQLHMTAAQSRYRCGIRGPIITVPAEATRADYPCFMPEWLGTELTRRIVVHGVAAVADPRGNLRYLTKAGDARITMIMEGALLKLSSPARQPVARLGDTLEIPILLSRSVQLPLAATVELVVPEEVTGLLRAEPLVLPPGQDRGTLRITTVADERLVGPWSLKLRATAWQDCRAVVPTASAGRSSLKPKATAGQDGKCPVISEFDLPVVLSSEP